MTVVELTSPSTKAFVYILLALINSMGVVVFGLLFVVPLCLVFINKKVTVGILIGAAILIWNLYSWFRYAPAMPHALTMIEWVSVIIIFPLIAKLTPRFRLREE